MFLALAMLSLRLVNGRIRMRPHIIPPFFRSLTMILPGTTTSLAMLLTKVLPLVPTILVIHTTVDLQEV